MGLKFFRLRENGIGLILLQLAIYWLFAMLLDTELVRHDATAYRASEILRLEKHPSIFRYCKHNVN